MSTSGGKAPAAGSLASANVLDGFANTAVAGTTTLITVPAGQTWVGFVGASCAITEAAAATTVASISAAITTANGTGTVTPAAGTYTRVDANFGAGAAGGTVGGGVDGAVASQRLVVVAPAGGTALVQLVVATANGASPQASGWAIGELQ